MNATVTYLDKRRRSAAGYPEPEHPCRQGVGGGRRCGRLDTQLYLAGWLCPEHQPGSSITRETDTEKTESSCAGHGPASDDTVPGPIEMGPPS